MATKKTTHDTSIPTTLIHEFNAQGEHRIVKVGAVAAVGAWTPYTSIAILDNLRAATDAYKGVLPLGVFMATERPHLTY